MIIRTQRFLLRPVTEADAPAFALLCNDEELARNTARVPHPYTLADARRFVGSAIAAFADKSEFSFAVCDRVSGDIVACAGIKCGSGDPELGYWVAAPARSKGVASEAAGAVVRFGFDTLGAEIIAAGHFTDNPASGRVLEKLGFKPTGERPDLFSMGRGAAAPTLRVALSRDDYFRAQTSFA